jgi:peptidoglycan/xylan/chitin deacetylase (PgdA/CDA1 family)
MVAWKRLVLSVCCIAALPAGVGSGLGAREVALTFDDLPRHGALPPAVTRVDVARSTIESLQQWNSPKTYGFINAKKLQDDPSGMEVLKLWRAAGFPLGNHTFSHMDLNANTVEEFEKDIALNEPLLRSLMGAEHWHWFRYPYLREGDTLDKMRSVAAHLKASGYRNARVTLDFEDYAWNGPYARCAEKNDAEAIEWLKASYLDTAAEYIELGQKMARIVHGRDIKHVMLLHIGGFNMVILPELLKLLRQRGFRLITLEDAYSDTAYESDPDLPSKFGKTLLEQMMIVKNLEIPKHKEKPFTKLEAICR